MGTLSAYSQPTDRLGEDRYLNVEISGMDLSLSVRLNPGFDSVADEAFFSRLLRGLPAAIGLEGLEPPIIYRFPSRHVPGENGVSGMMLMVQSHVAFHWWPKENFLHVTVSSCRQFDPEIVRELLLIACRGSVGPMGPTAEITMGGSRW